MMKLNSRKASSNARLLFLYDGLLLLLGLAWFLSSAASVLGANPSRFVARFANGSFVEGNNLADWHVPDAIPKLDSQALFDANNPLRWLLDRSLFPTQPGPEAFVEFATGDRLPGSVIDYQMGASAVYSRLPPHFAVRIEGVNPATLELQTAVVRVDANLVRRIVWSGHRVGPFEPRTVFLRDGSFLRYRSMRWSPGFVSILLESGQRRIAWEDVAEVHFAPRDFWSTYFDELATLSPDGQRRLLQLEDVNGLIVTTSLDRMLPRFVGDPKDINRWLLGVQPAWSLDVLWIVQGRLWARRGFAPHEVPLTRVPPMRFEQNSIIGSGKFPYQVNRNGHSGVLRSKNREAGWGFGVQAFCELEFELPPSSRTMRSEFAIDAAMKSGGCVQPKVINSSAGNAVLYQGPVIAGSESVVDTGALGINGPTDAVRKIVLQVDPVLTNRPANADPFSIRDQANWLDPTVELDVVALKQQLDSRLNRQVLPWNDWTLQIEPGAEVRRTNFFAEVLNSGEYLPAISVTGKELKLTKNHTLTLQDQWLVIDAVRTQPPGPPCKLMVKIADDKPVEWDVPAYDKSRTDFRPLILPLAPLQGKVPMVAVEVRQLPTPEKVPVLWRALSFVEQHPLYYKLLEDSPTAVSNAENVAKQLGAGEFDSQQKYSGTQSLRLTIPAALKIPLNAPVAIRERPQLGEYRFVRFAVRKQGGGGIRLEIHHPASVDRPAGYEAGKNEVIRPNWKRLSNQALPADWQVFTRDLYADFGNLDVMDLSIEFPDGEQAWLDHVYFARTQNDFELIKAHLPQAR